MNKVKKNNDLEFFFVCLKIGIGALIYRGGIELLSTVLYPFFNIFVLIAPENTVFVNSLNYVYSAIVSVGAFLCAAIMLWISLRIGKRKNYQPTYWRWKLTVFAPFLIITTVAINFAMAEINALMISLLAPGVGAGLSVASGADISIIEVLLLLISTAVIPGIVEEIMFRGIILTNLAPYGKGMAIVCSALLFGLMHMNPSQFFYTTLMGLILGYLYVRTRSIWICIIIHFTNNALGVVQQIIYQCNGTSKADELMSQMMIIVAVLGLVSVGVLLIVRAVNRRKSPEEKGSFGRLYDSALSYEAVPVTKWKKMLLFFSPSVSLFTVIVFASMIIAMVGVLIAGLLLGMFPGMVTL